MPVVPSTHSVLKGKPEPYRPPPFFGGSSEKAVACRNFFDKMNSFIEQSLMDDEV